MDKQEIINVLKDRLVEGKLPCAVAFAVAKEYTVAIGEIGNIANQEGIKITDCQLGCFGKNKK